MMKLGKNSMIGMGLIGAAIILAMLVNWFGSVVAESQAGICGMEPEVCPHSKNIPLEVYLGYTISLVIGLVGVYLIITDLRKSKLKNDAAEDWKKVTSALQGDERAIYELIASAEGVMFQSGIVEKSGLSKVKVSRVLDRLEARNLLERRRRGMSNVVVLKQK
jgi:uncharacterized membrane protein